MKNLNKGREGITREAADFVKGIVLSGNVLKKRLNGGKKTGAVSH